MNAHKQTNLTAKTRSSYSRPCIAFFLNMGDQEVSAPELMAIAKTTATPFLGNSIWRGIPSADLNKHPKYFRCWAAMILTRIMRDVERIERSPKKKTHWEFLASDFKGSQGKGDISHIFASLSEGLSTARRYCITRFMDILTFASASPSGDERYRQKLIAAMYEISNNKIGLETSSPIKGGDICVYDFTKWQHNFGGGHNRNIPTTLFSGQETKIPSIDECLIDDSTPEGIATLTELVVRFADRSNKQSLFKQADVDALQSVIYRKIACIKLEQSSLLAGLPVVDPEEISVIIHTFNHDGSDSIAMRSVSNAVNCVHRNIKNYFSSRLAIHQSGKDADIAINACQARDICLATKAACVIWGEYFDANKSIAINITIPVIIEPDLLESDSFSLQNIKIDDLAVQQNDFHNVLSGFMLLISGMPLIKHSTADTVAEALEAFLTAKEYFRDHIAFRGLCMHFEWRARQMLNDADNANILLDEMVNLACSSTKHFGFVRCVFETLCLSFAYEIVLTGEQSKNIERRLSHLHRLLKTYWPEGDLLPNMCKAISRGLMAAYSLGWREDTRRLGEFLCELREDEERDVRILKHVVGSLPLALPALPPELVEDAISQLNNAFQRIAKHLDNSDIVELAQIGLDRLLIFIQTLPNWDIHLNNILEWARYCYNINNQVGAKILADSLFHGIWIAQENNVIALADQCRQQLVFLKDAHSTNLHLSLTWMLSLLNEMKRESLATGNDERMIGLFADIRTNAKREGLSRYGKVAYAWALRMYHAKCPNHQADFFKKELNNLAASELNEVKLIATFGNMAAAVLDYHNDAPDSENQMVVLAGTLKNMGVMRNSIINWHLIDLASLLRAVVGVAQSKHNLKLTKTFLSLLYELAKTNPNCLQIQAEYNKALFESCQDTTDSFDTVLEFTLAYHKLALERYSAETLAMLSTNLHQAMSYIVSHNRSRLAPSIITWQRAIYKRHDKDNIIALCYASTLVNAVEPLYQMKRLDDIRSTLDEMVFLNNRHKNLVDMAHTLLNGYFNVYMVYAKEHLINDMDHLFNALSDLQLHKTDHETTNTSSASFLHNISLKTILSGFLKKSLIAFNKLQGLADKCQNNKNVQLYYGEVIVCLARTALLDGTEEDFNTYHGLFEDLMSKHGGVPGMRDLRAKLFDRRKQIYIEDVEEEEGGEYARQGEVRENDLCGRCKTGAFIQHGMRNGPYGPLTTWFICNNCGKQLPSDIPCPGY